VFIVDKIKGGKCYGHIYVDVKKDTLWIDLRSDLAGKTVSNGAFVVAAKQIFADDKEVKGNDFIPNNPNIIIMATVTFGVLCITC
jgi:hypothetical protein